MPDSISISLFAPRYHAEIKQVLQSHGGDLDADRAFFPPGTVKRRVLFTRFAIIFPDGFQIEVVEFEDGSNMLIVPLPGLKAMRG